LRQSSSDGLYGCTLGETLDRNTCEGLERFGISVTVNFAIAVAALLKSLFVAAEPLGDTCRSGFRSL
jgi:hypothetical protein